MSRLSREQKRARVAAGAASGGRADSAMTPIEVRVPVPGPAGRAASGDATIGGMPVFAGPGEVAQQAVLDYLHRLALASGQPVLATVHDERIGFVVPIRVYVDGSSEFTGEPARLETPAEARPGGIPAPSDMSPPPPPPPVQPQPKSQPQPQSPRPDEGTHLLRAPAAEGQMPPDVPAHPGATVATFALRAVPERTPLITATPGPAQVLPGIPVLPDAAADGNPPAPAPEQPLGTVPPPVGEFGPPPVISNGPVTPPPPPPLKWEPPRTPEPIRDATPPPPVPAPAPEPKTPAPASASGTDYDTGADLYAAPEWKSAGAKAEDDEPKPPPVREFDSVAEAVLAPESAEELAGPMTRINEAVKQGRIEEAAGMAEVAVTEAAATLGAEHTDVLRLRELTSYIAYLAGDALRSFHLSLDLARLRRRTGDPRGAYGNVQSAAAAWRAVRDPIQGLDLGRDLIDVWAEMAAEPGPAAEDLDQLTSARNRMNRLADRAARTRTEDQPGRQ